MISILDYALNYLSQGIPAIPSNPKTKIPLVKWSDYQARLPTKEETLTMFGQFPKAMISLVTGQISNLIIVDADSIEAVKLIEDNIPDSCETTIDISPRGGRHYWWLLNGKQWNTKSSVLKNIDIRANGGVIVAPPSRNEAGVQYRWLNDAPFDKSMLQEMPESLCKLLESAQTEKKPKFTFDLNEVKDLYKEGRRDSDLFHLALSLCRAGETKEYILRNMMLVARSWHEEKEIEWFKQKIESAFQHEEKHKRNYTEEVREWVLSSNGIFLFSEIDKALQLLTREEKKNVSKILGRLVEEKIIERYGNKNGCFRKVDNTLEKIDWEMASEEHLDIKLPLCVTDYCNINPSNILIIAGCKDAGKGHPDGTKILTPVGWKNIETLNIGDDVFAEDGTVTKITGVYPRGMQQCFEFVFSDKTSVITDFEHLWKIQNDYYRSAKKTGRGKTNKNYKGWQILEAYKLLVLYGGFGKSRTRKTIIIPLNKPLIYPEKCLPIDPYIMGLLLGDGCFCKDSVEFTSADKVLVDYIKQFYQVTRSNETVITYRIKKIYKEIKNLGLKGKHSWDKHIPIEYLQSSIEQRIALLRGLMDTDGDISQNGKTICFSTTSQQLADDVMFLVRSLGGKVLTSKRYTCYKYKKVKKEGRLSYRLFITFKNFCPFLLKRKMERYKPKIKYAEKKLKEIRNAGIQKTTCISIDNPNGLYISNDFIVTHNSAFCLNTAILNLHKYKINYYSNEMGDVEIKRRLKKAMIHLCVSMESLRKINFYKRLDNFADIIQDEENTIHIIDYVDVTKDAFLIGEVIKTIFGKLKKSVCLIALQKDYGKDLARGGASSLDKARIYVTLEHGKGKIVSGKDWVTEHINPAGLELNYKLVQGCKFIVTSDWKSPIKNHDDR